MKDNKNIIRASLEGAALERKVMSSVIRSMDDITLVVKALTDDYYYSKKMIYMQEIKRRINSSNINDINRFFERTLDSVFGDERYYSYGLKLQKKRIPEV